MIPGSEINRAWPISQFSARVYNFGHPAHPKRALRPGSPVGQSPYCEPLLASKPARTDRRKTTLRADVVENAPKTGGGSAQREAGGLGGPLPGDPVGGATARFGAQREPSETADSRGTRTPGEL